MSKFFDEFKKFALRGNMIDLAVGIIVGGAFNQIVNSLVSDIIMPPIGLLIGGVNFTDLSIVLKHAEVAANGTVISPAVALNYGNFLQAVFNFLIVAFAVFLFVRLMNRLFEQKQPPAQKPEDVQLLSEIRDLLKKQNTEPADKPQQ